MSEEEQVPAGEGTPKRFSQNCINQFFACRLCHEELPRGVSIAHYARLHAGLTDRGLQVWCARHEVNIIHFDFEGATLRGSDRIDDEDREAFVARMPELSKVLEQNKHYILQAGLAVLRERVDTVGLKEDPNDRQERGTSYGELLRAFSVELDRYLFTGTPSPDWEVALKLIKFTYGEGVLS